MPLHRQFIKSGYLAIKQHNPDLPVLIREASGTPARVFARFGASRVLFVCFVQNKLTGCTCCLAIEHGVERHVELDYLPASDVEAKVAQLLAV